ncbi:MAG: hypothetical protein JOY54_12480 [Acidobacteriaceae bacterium]|nr:hypothetical protein [Acidobacteriaceae bacterium]
MAHLARALFLLTVLKVAGHFFDTNAASAQEPRYVAVTTDSLKIMAERLKRDLQDGSIQLADLHAMQLRLALLGVLSEEMSAKIRALEQLPAPDKPEPQFTAGLIPLADKLRQALDEPNLGLATRYAGQLAAQIHAQQELYRGRQVESAATGDIDFDRYFDASNQLQDSLRKGDVASAAVLAVEVQSAQDAISAKKKQAHFSLISRDAYNINDALGRAAFLRKDYLAACDYLLKAADTPGRNAVLRSFGPDLWLARALLTAGYKDVVLIFQERCKAFWSIQRLDQWISILQSGGSPDFRMNIFSDEPVLSH